MKSRVVIHLINVNKTYTEIQNKSRERATAMKVVFQSPAVPNQIAPINQKETW